MEKTKEAALEWVNNGNLCIFRYGWAYRGARARVINKDEALERLKQNKQWGFGMGFYKLSWRTHEGKPCLEFNELSANDME